MPKIGTIYGNATWIEIVLVENPLRYINMDFTIQFPQEACCPILLKAPYKTLEKNKCFSYNTLKQKEFLMRARLFYLDPLKYRTSRLTRGTEFTCNSDYQAG